MLLLSRREGQAIIVDNTVEVRVVAIKGKSVKLGISSPTDRSVLREEVFLQIKEANQAARAASVLAGDRPERREGERRDRDRRAVDRREGAGDDR